MKWIFLLTFCSFTWGSAFSVAKIGMEHMSPLYFIAIRFSIAGLLLLLFTWKTVIPQIKKEHVILISKLSAILFFAFATFLFAIKNTTAINAGFFVTSSVVMIPGLAFFINKSPINKRTIFGVTICFLGLFLLSFDGGSFSLNIGDIISLVSAVLFALHVVFTARYVKQMDPMVLCSLQFIFVAIYGFIAAIFIESVVFYGPINTIGMSALLYTTIFATLIPYILQTYSQRHLSESYVGIILSTEPIFGAIVAFILLGETLGLIGILGGAVVVGSIVYINPINNT